MLVMIENKKEIKKIQRDFMNMIRKSFDKKIRKQIGYPGGGVGEVEISTNDDLWYWESIDERQDKSPRFLNWFGVVNSKKNLDISVELNIPLEGINNRVAGFFARDITSNRIYLCHTGGVGGGTEGVGRTEFLVYANSPLDQVQNSKGELRQCIVVIVIDDNENLIPLINYIKLIVSFKLAVRNNELNSADFLKKVDDFKDYYSEFYGRKIGTRSKEIDYVSWHGAVVDALSNWITQNTLINNQRLVKNVYIDLGVEINGSLKDLYEVKTNISRNSIYTGIGQLMFHSVTIEGCTKNLVIPASEDLSQDIKLILENLNIKIIRYKIERKRIKILSQ